jgi:hypothetical protein
MGFVNASNVYVVIVGLCFLVVILSALGMWIQDRLP